MISSPFPIIGPTYDDDELGTKNYKSSPSSPFDYNSLKDPSPRPTQAQLPYSSFDANDLKSAVISAEYYRYPNRVPLLIIYRRLLQNSMISSLIYKRNIVTLSKQIDLKLDDQILPISDKITKSKWFNEFKEYILMNIYYGYGGIYIGENINQEFKNYELKRREYINPDLRSMTTTLGYPSGIRYDIPPISDKVLITTTTNDVASMKCGFGILYKIMTEFMFYSQTRSQWGNYNSKYGTPFIHAKTDIQNDQLQDKEYSEDLYILETALINSSKGTLITPKDTDITIVEPAKGSNKDIFLEFIKLNKEEIKGLILGHENAMESTPGSLGNTNGKDSQEYTTFKMIIDNDCKFLENELNNNLLPLMGKNGFKIPAGSRFIINNQKQDLEEKLLNIKIAKDLGYKVPKSEIEKLLGIKLEDDTRTTNQ